MKCNLCFQILFLSVLLTSCSLTNAQRPEVINTGTHTAVNPLSTEVLYLQEYVGLTYPPYPNSVVFQWGASIYPSKDDNKWSVSRISVSAADNSLKDMLWLSKVVSYDGNGIPKFEVSDVLVLPLETEKYVIAVNTCLLSGVIDPEVVALAKWDDSINITRFLPNNYILMAWRANQTTGKFEELSIENIECNFE